MFLFLQINNVVSIEEDSNCVLRGGECVHYPNCEDWDSEVCSLTLKGMKHVVILKYKYIKII